MAIGDAETVCRIAADRQRLDVALADLVVERYLPLRPHLTEDVLTRALLRNRAWLDDWRHLCEDKRTSGGWALVHDAEWRVYQPYPEDGDARDRRFGDDEAAACAAFILAELDHVAAHL